MTIVESMKATPAHGWMTRQTDSPPKRAAIQPKIGVQIGIPVKTQMKNVSATAQWINREAAVVADDLVADDDVFPLLTPR